MDLKETFKVEKTGAFNSIVWLVIGLFLFFYVIAPLTDKYVMPMFEKNDNDVV